MAVDPKEFLFRHGEKVVFGASVAFFLGVVALKLAGSDEELDTLSSREQQAMSQIEALVKENKSAAQQQTLKPPALAEATKGRWLRPAAPYPAHSHWAFYATPDVNIEVEAPPQEHVVRGPTGLTVKATQTDVTLTWKRPPMKVSVPSREDPSQTEERTVANVWGYAIYRWKDDAEKAGKGGRSHAENLFQVLNLGGDQLEWMDKAGLEPNETYYYLVTLLSDNSEAENGQEFVHNGATLRESKEATQVASAQIPDNVEITLLSISDLGSMQTARIRVRKNVGGTWWVDEYGLVRKGERVGKARSFPKEGGEGASSPKPIDMTTKYVVKEIQFEEVPRMQSQTIYKWRFMAGGEKKEAWAATKEDLLKQNPEADPQTIDNVHSTTEAGFEKKVIEIEMIDSSTGKPSMTKRWKILVENTEAKAGQKAEIWIAEQSSK